MSKKQKPFTDEEKKRIAQKAATGGDKTVQQLSEEYGVSEEEIRIWIRESDVRSVIDQTDEVSLEASDDFIDSVNYGATYDRLNYRRLMFWSIFGIAVIVIFIQSVKFIFDFTTTSTTQGSAQQSEFFSIDQLKQNDSETLESFGVVDPEAGIYRIPIDSAITLVANE